MFKGAVGVIAATGGYLYKKGDQEIKDARRHSESVKDDLANFKLAVSNDYSKEVNTQASLARLHDRLDGLGDKMDEIKTLILREKK